MLTGINISYKLSFILSADAKDYSLLMTADEIHDQVYQRIGDVL
jgi:hypothetical protein